VRGLRARRNRLPTNVQDRRLLQKRSGRRPGSALAQWARATGGPSRSGPLGRPAWCPQAACL